MRLTYHNTPSDAEYSPPPWHTSTETEPSATPLYNVDSKNQNGVFEAVELQGSGSQSPTANKQTGPEPTEPSEGGGLKRDISTRQMLLIAAGGSIGAGLFVGSGQALAVGGPGSLVVNFAFVGLMVCFTMAALGEMATAYPVAGAFYDYTVRFIGPQIGFAMGWNFVFNWMIILPFELTTIGAQLRFWQPDLQPYYFIAPFLAFLAFVSFMGARWFAELEHWLGVCKAVAISAFICFALALTTGGVKDDPRGALHDRYWHTPGAFLNGFQGFLSVFRIAGMAYGGTEMLGLTAAECRRPHRIMPLATKVVFFRLIVFYIGALLMLGFAVPADSPQLATVGKGAKYSPFVLAANLAGLPGLGSFFNAMIVAALVAMANTSAYASSRALQALCAKEMGPSFFAAVSRRGIPVRALLLAFAVALIAFVTVAPGGEEIFDWLLSLAGISNYVTWASICYGHIRMRAAMGVQGQSLKELIWRSPFGVWGSYVGIVVCFLGLLAQILSALWPISGVYEAKAVVRDLLGFAFMVFLFGGYFLYRRLAHGDTVLLVPLATIDLSTGFRDRASAFEADREVEGEKAAEMQQRGFSEDWTDGQKRMFRLKRALKLV